MNQSYTPPPKKTNWGMIIVILLLIPLLILGSIWAYKNLIVSNNSTSKNLQKNSPVFPLNGTWYLDMPGENSKLIFDPPMESEGKLKGNVDFVFNDQSDGKVYYEVLDQGRLRISDPQGYFNAWEFNYSYDDANDVLIMHADGQQTRYTRVRPPSNTNNTQNNNNNNNNNINTSNTTSNPNEAYLWAEADKFTKGTWTKFNDATGSLTKITFERPRMENGQMVGQSIKEVHSKGYCKLISKRKYTILPNGQYKTENLSETCDGVPDNSEVGKVSVLYYEFSIDNNGNQILSVGNTKQEMENDVPYYLK